MTKVLSPQSQTIGGYQILEQIAKGSTGTVFKASDPRTGALVAVKVIPQEVVANEVLRLRFAQECQVSRQLVHPHIVRVLDFGLDGVKAYMVMEYVDGESVGDRLEREGRLPQAEALRLIHQAGQALHWAHQRRLIHRDVKPDNILITAEGQAKLADLGLVKNLESEHHLTKPLDCLGTPNFMPPEQFEDPTKADVRCDVYSLAATLYMMVTGELPFRARSASAVAAIYKKQCNNEVVPPRRVAPDVSPHVEAAILRGMRADPAERFASVTDFLDALTSAPSPTGAAMPGAPVKTATGAGRREDRRKNRFACERVTTCRALQRRLDESWSAHILDMSETGLSMRLERRFEPGTLLTLVLEGGNTRRWSLVVRVVWVKRQAKNLYKLGCQYDQPLSDFEVQEFCS